MRQKLRRRFLSLGVVLLIGVTATTAYSAEPDTTALRDAINAVLGQANVSASKVGIQVTDVETQEVLYARNTDVRFNPASNAKLVTTAVALEHRGPGHTIFTRLSARSVSSDGTVKGPIYLKSDGDPMVLYEDVVRWAIELKRQGVKNVPDGIVVDDTSFEPGFMPPAFDQKDTDAAYRPPIGAVSVNYNQVTVRVTPAAAGEPARVELFPPNDHVQIVNSARTTSGRSQRVQVSAKPVDEAIATTVTVSGTIGTAVSGIEVRKRIDNPSAFAGAVLKQALIDIGVEVEGPVVVGTRPDDTESLYLHESKPLVYHLMMLNKWSNNFMAEQVFRLLGRDENEAASEEVARARIIEFLNKAGLGEGFAVVNGSGLYDGNLYTTQHFTQLLTYMASHRYAPEFRAAMAIAGVDGTMRKRVEESDGRLRGKTGTLNEVTALTGYATTRSGRDVAYVILFNDTPVRAWLLRSAQDRIARAIAEFDQ